MIILKKRKIFSDVIGLAKALKNGVARPIDEGGSLNGFLSGRFILTYFACGSALLARGLSNAFVVNPPGVGVSSQ